MKKAIYPGSFDILTNGHLWIIEQSSNLFDELIIGVGCNKSKNMIFSLEERVKILKENVGHFDNVEVVSFYDKLLVNYMIEKNINYVVRGIRNNKDFEYEKEMMYINNELAKISYVFFIPPKDLQFISSSLIKGMAGLKNWENAIKKFIPYNVLNYLKEKI